ncbi:unannotated protein [freshwater metagenome]|uniref:Unannotated protein n=1 Tax=freshwater metagenome TaxID=449393 RepID=A0A6J7DT88_9ZZZZ
MSVLSVLFAAANFAAAASAAAFLAASAFFAASISARVGLGVFAIAGAEVSTRPKITASEINFLRERTRKPPQILFSEG